VKSQLLGSRDEPLPAKFTAAERKAYRWLWDCGVCPWTVDLLTKRVNTPDREYANLVEFKRAVIAFNRSIVAADDGLVEVVCPRCGSRWATDAEWDAIAVVRMDAKMWALVARMEAAKATVRVRKVPRDNREGR